MPRPLKFVGLKFVLEGSELLTLFGSTCPPDLRGLHGVYHSVVASVMPLELLCAASIRLAFQILTVES